MRWKSRNGVGPIGVGRANRKNRGGVFKFSRDLEVRQERILRCSIALFQGQTRAFNLDSHNHKEWTDVRRPPDCSIW